MTVPTSNPNQVLTCPQCGGAMDYQKIGTDRRAKCQYCQTVVDLPDFEPAAVPPRVEYTARPILTQKDDKLAKTSLIVAIIGLTGFLPVVGSIAAIFMGRQALKNIETEPNVYTGEQMARGAVIIGWVGLGFNALTLCFYVGIEIFKAVMTLIQQAR